MTPKKRATKSHTEVPKGAKQDELLPELKCKAEEEAPLFNTTTLFPLDASNAFQIDSIFSCAQGNCIAGVVNANVP